MSYTAQDDFKANGFNKLKEMLLDDSSTNLIGRYKGIVTKCKTDDKKAQFVRVKIFGLTDSLPNNVQPWAEGTGTHPVPSPGTYVDITFANGDIHFPLWSNPSKASNGALVTKGQKQSKQKNQEIYNSQDGTTISYNKSTGVYMIDHSSGAKFSIDNEGVLSHKSGPNGIPLPLFNVLTEATICPFTQKLHFGGSPYLKVSATPGI